MSATASTPARASVPTRARSAAQYGSAIVRFIWTHPANSGARGQALLRAARYQLRARVARQRTLAQLGDRSQLWVDLHRSAASKVLYANPPDYQEMLVWREVLRPGDLFVDVGANIGCYSVWAGEMGANVIALEPADDTFALLRENIALNGYAIQPVQAAAGATCGTAGFTSGRDAGNQFDPGGAVQAAMVTVDSLIGGRPVAGMKVDVEGFELEVLRGCEQALAAQRIALIQLEWNATSETACGTDRKPVADLLTRHGYGLFRPDRRGRLLPVTGTGYGEDVFARPLGGPTVVMSRSDEMGI